MKSESSDSASPLPSHTGILRDETLILRQLLGHYGDVEATLPTLPLSKRANGLHKSPMKDFLFVRLDIDTFQGYEKLLPDHQLHVGISLLDTRDLESALLNPASRDHSQMIMSHQFSVMNSRYSRRASNRFLFGTSQPTTIEELKSKVEALIDADRDIVLVSHGTSSDLKIIHQLNINLANRSLYIIDTNKAAQFPLQLYYRYGLEKLLDALQIPFASLHAAGNDARFCLQALLMLVVRDAERQPLDFSEALIHLLRDVAQQPRPSTAGEIQGPIQEANRQAKIDRKARRIEKRAAKRQRKLLLRAEQEGKVPHAEESEASDDAPSQEQLDEGVAMSSTHVVWLVCAGYTMYQL